MCSALPAGPEKAEGSALTARLSRGQVTTVKDVRGSSALFLYRKVAAAPAREPVFVAGPPMDASEAAMSVRFLGCGLTASHPFQRYLRCIVLISEYSCCCNQVGWNST